MKGRLFVAGPHIFQRFSKIFYKTCGNKFVQSILRIIYKWDKTNYRKTLALDDFELVGEIVDDF